jgi:hypothetical protein
VDWLENIAISDLAPSAYWPAQVTAKRLEGIKLQNATYRHALPEGWTDMPYEDFLAERRKRMAIVVRDALGRLQDAKYQPATNAPPTLDSAVEEPMASSLSNCQDLWIKIF